MRHLNARTVWAVLLLLAASRPTSAQPAGSAFTYQGRLTDNGTAVTGAFDIQCALFSAAAGGAQVGPTVTLNDVAVANGLFTVNLDFGAAAFAGSVRFLEIGVRPGASTGAYTVLGARQELKPAPHAVFTQTSPWTGLTGKPAGFADDVDNDSGGDITGITVGTGLTGGGATGAVSLGLDFPAVALNHNHFGQTWNGSQTSGLDVNNSAVNGAALRAFALATTGFGVAVLASSDAASGIGIDGNASGTAVATGVRGVSGSTNGRGVFGWALAGSGTPVGVRGETSASSGIGVEGVSTALAAGVGMRGRSVATSQGYGVVGLVEPTAGTDGVGVYGHSTRGGFGVMGVGPPTNFSAGVAGFTATTDGVGVRGEASPSSGSTIGVYGLTVSSLGRGVWGRSNSSLGGHAGWFTGTVNVNGTLTKSAGSFKIDHPLDPENKYLSHSFVESPEMMNVYAGNVVTGGDGFATVELPDWFEALNRDFRYQLTVLDEGDSDAFVHAKVVRKIAGNRFTIRTSAPRAEVSWMVTGVRKDAYAEKHRIPVEEWKEPGARGTYIHPADWGQPAERGEDWRLEHGLDSRPMPAPPPPHRDR
jgi:hypothetical protein